MSEDLHSPARAVRPRQENAGGMPALPGTTPGLQLRHEPVADLHDVAPVDRG